jgi:hypothetical protein
MPRAAFTDDCAVASVTKFILARALIDSVEATDRPIGTEAGEHVTRDTMSMLK